ncbi:MAG TPA: amidohydrolase [Nocardioidaceae bacterium]
MTSHPDLVFTGGAVFTLDDGPPAEAVAVRDGVIVAVGDAGVRELAGPTTEVVDLAGGLLVPGFQDAHVHPVGGGLERLQCDLSENSTREEYLATIRAYADANPEAKWITGGGWAMAAFPGGTPTAADLDGVVSDRPVFLPNRDHHGAWVNSRALEVAGIDGSTPDPVDGVIERDEHGRPTGTLHEGAMHLVGRHAPRSSLDELVAALLEGQRYLHSFGVTAWQDAIVGGYANLDDPSEAYRALVANGRLTAKVVGALWWERDLGAEQIPYLVEQRQRLTSGRFRATSVKIMQDGVPENFTAHMLDPYLDRAGATTSNRGLPFVDPKALRGYVTELDKNGFQVHVHAIGDAAVRETLDAFEAAKDANGVQAFAAHRHHIAHIQVIHPDDVSRFAALGVTANMQALWAAYEPQMTELTIPFLGDERAGWQYPFLDLVRSGAPLAMGSDWPVSTPNPLAAIHVAANRVLPDAEGDDRRPFYADQGIDVVTALTAYTAGSARVNHLDDTGTIEVGKAADLAVLDRDIRFVEPETISDTRVLATYVDGHQVF